MAFRGSLLDIRLFVAAYEERSFTAAAARENSTQSGVSHHIRQLEMLLDIKLFVREKGGVSATPVADLLYDHCVGLLSSLDGAANAVEQFRGGLEGSISVGIIPALTHRIAAPALLRFNEMHPNVRVRIVEGYSTLLPSAVVADDIDCAICTFDGEVPGIRATSLFATTECLVSRIDRDRGELPNDGIKMIWASGMERRRTAITSLLSRKDICIRSSLEVDSALASLDLVGRSDWRMVNPIVMFDPLADSATLSVKPLEDLSFDVVMLQRSSTSLKPEAEAFCRVLADEAERVTKAWAARTAELCDPRL